MRKQFINKIISSTLGSLFFKEKDEKFYFLKTHIRRLMTKVRMTLKSKEVTIGKKIVADFPL
jgi:hypothetical protein